MNHSTVKVALIGIAGYGDHYLEALLHNPRASGARLVAVADPAAHRCTRLPELRQLGIPIFADLESLLTNVPVDLVMIATPIHLHAAQTCLALDHGVNVLCEKPLASALADALHMLACEQRNGNFVAIGYQWSFSDAVQALKRDVMAGVLGRPIRFKTIVFFPRGIHYFRRNDWVGKLRTTGGEPVLDSPVNNATAHYLHNMLYLLGRSHQSSAVPVMVQSELYRANAIENYDTAALRVVTDQGVEILFYTTHAVGKPLGPVCHFEFENGVVEYDPAKSSTFVARLGDGTIRDYGSPNLDRHQKLWQCIEATQQATRDRSQIACGVRAALPHTLCVLAAQQSAPVIATFDSALQRIVSMESDSLICVEGLAEALLDCYQRGILPNERGDLHWSVTPASVRVPDLRLDAPNAAAPVAAPATPISVETFVQPVQFQTG
jgi:predicted dehydrogenase